MIELVAAISLTLGAIIASATGVSASDVMVMNAFARASATPVARSGAAYVSVMNHGATPDRLLAVRSDSARSVEVHKTEMADGVMKMQAVGALELPANGMLEMKPGGYHIMLMGLSSPLKQGATLELTLVFEKAGEVKVSVPVGGVAEGGHDHGEGSSSGG